MIQLKSSQPGHNYSFLTLVKALDCLSYGQKYQKFYQIFFTVMVQCIYWRRLPAVAKRQKQHPKRIPTFQTEEQRVDCLGGQEKRRNVNSFNICKSRDGQGNWHHKINHQQYSIKRPEGFFIDANVNHYPARLPKRLSNTYGSPLQSTKDTRGTKNCTLIFQE